MTQSLNPRVIPSTASGEPIRVLVVDDSSVIRGIVSRWIEASADMVLAGAAVNGSDAIKRAAALRPDIIILDIEMPEMDGITALPQLLRLCPQSRIIMASTLTRRNAEISLKALSLGASDYVPKPTSISGGDAAEDFKRELMTRIIALGRRRLASTSAEPRTPAATVARAQATSAGAEAPQAVVKAAAMPVHAAAKTSLPLQKSSSVPAQIIAIGSSTGGPQALVQVVSALAADLNVPVVITQHMPPTFTSILAESIARSSGLQCIEAVNGMMLERRCVYVAPGDYHMTIKGRGGPIELNQAPPENFCRPAVDPMFRSVAAAYGPLALGVVLTGMGSDGREGARAIVGAGGTVIAQDEETSIVWGMPGAVAVAGLASAILPLDLIGAEIKKKTGVKSR
jgi:two-component system chemotaxis response regulator CheB